jgi:hypothetical protein
MQIEVCFNTWSSSMEACVYIFQKYIYFNTWTPNIAANSYNLRRKEIIIDTAKGREEKESTKELRYIKT